MLNDVFIYQEAEQAPAQLSVHVEDPRRERSTGRAWECRVEIPGHIESFVVHGSSPIQAMAGALRFVRETLQGLQATGKLTYRDGNAVVLSELFATG